MIIASTTAKMQAKSRPRSQRHLIPRFVKEC
jgi:hypothetical protein